MAGVGAFLPRFLFMKYLLLILGLILVLTSLYSLGLYVFDYNELTNYGRGFIWGKILILIIGLILVTLGYKRMKNT